MRTKTVTTDIIRAQVSAQADRERCSTSALATISGAVPILDRINQDANTALMECLDMIDTLNNVVADIKASIERNNTTIANITALMSGKEIVFKGDNDAAEDG